MARTDIARHFSFLFFNSTNKHYFRYNQYKKHVDVVDFQNIKFHNKPDE